MAKAQGQRSRITTDLDFNADGHITKAEAAMRESEGRFRLLADIAPAPIWLTDARGAIQFANAARRAPSGPSVTPANRAGNFATADNAPGTATAPGACTLCPART